MEPRDPLSPTPTLTGPGAPSGFKAEKSSRGSSVPSALAHEATNASPPPRDSSTGLQISPSSPSPGAGDIPEPKDSLTGRTIGGCEIVKWLGRGGMGSVYLGRQVSLDRPVAFKVISESAQRDESFLRRFEREAKTIAKFNSSRIVQIYEVGFDQGIHFILMEFVSGGDLKKKTAEQGRVPPEQAAAYTRQAAEGLLAAEKQKIVHRDLKPENLMLDANGEIKITDFGLAKMLQTENITLTQMGDYLGTPIYMSPEQAQGITLDHRSDMYSLGATLYFLLTGVHPYTGGSVYEILKKKTEYEYLDPTTSNLEQPIPEGLCNIMRHMTALQPKDRYASFKDLIEDLDRWQRGEPTQMYRGRRKRGLAKRLALVLVPAVLAVAGMRYRSEISGMFLGGPPPEPTQRSQAATASACVNIQERLKVLAERVKTEDPTLSLVNDLSTIRSDIISSSCNDSLKGANDLMDGTIEKLVENHETSITNTQSLLASSPSIGVVKDAILLREKTKEIPAGTSKKMQERLGKDLEKLDASIQDGLGDLVKKQQHSLANYKTQLKQGPSSSLSNNVNNLEKGVVEYTNQLTIEIKGLKESATLKSDLTGLKASLEALNKDIAEGLRIDDKLRLLPKPTVAVPFTELPSYLMELREALKPSGPVGDELKEWLAAEEKSRVENVGQKSEEALRASLQAAEAEKDRFARGESPSQDLLLGMVATLDAGKKALVASFPGTEVRWEAAAPDARIKDLTAVMTTRRGDQKRLLEITDAIDATDKLFPEPTKTVEWSPQLKEQIQAGVLKGRSDLKALESKPALKADITRLGARLDGQEKKSASLDQNAKALVEATKSFEAHRLKDAGGMLEALKRANPDDVRVEKLLAARKAMDEGFAGLIKDLSLPRARDSFEAARTACTEAGLSTAYPDQCLDRLKKLEALTDRKMVPVARGRVRVDGAAAVEVKGFFIDKTEVAIEDFLRFQANLKKKSFADVKGIWPSAELFQKDSNQPPYLGRTPDYSPLWPIEEVSYYHAVAYMKDQGKDLFTLEEWWLAARGIESRPAGDVREPHNSIPKQVDMEGEAFNLPGVYHLQGNVAEWTTSKKGNSYCVVGSRHADPASKAFLLYMGPEETRGGCGFRGIIRPGAFFEGLLEPAPAGAPAGSGGR